MIVHPKPDNAVAATADVQAYAKAEGDGRNTIFALWQPPIGIFDMQDPMGSGDFRISLNPNSDFEKQCTQTLNNHATSNVVVNDVKFYICTIKQSSNDLPMTMNLMECSVQSKPVSGKQAQLEFTVPSSTRQLTMFVQTGSPSGVLNRNIPPTRLVASNGSEKSINSLQMSYANVTKPSTRWNSAYDDKTNQLTQRYFDTHVASGLFANVGGIETFREYVDRGVIFHYDFTRDANDRSTQVQIACDFTEDLPANTNIFLAAWYSRITEISTQNGRIQEVKSLNA